MHKQISKKYINKYTNIESVKFITPTATRGTAYQWKGIINTSHIPSERKRTQWSTRQL